MEQLTRIHAVQAYYPRDRLARLKVTLTIDAFSSIDQGCRCSGLVNTCIAACLVSVKNGVVCRPVIAGG